MLKFQSHGIQQIFTLMGMVWINKTDSFEEIFIKLFSLINFVANL